MKRIKLLIILFFAVNTFSCMDALNESMNSIKKSKIVSLMLWNDRNRLPEAPSDLTATVISESQIDLTWKDNSDNETGFKVLRSKENSGYSEIGSVKANEISYSDKGLGNEVYHYYIVAYNKRGDSKESNKFSAKPSNVNTFLMELNSVGAHDYINIPVYNPEISEDKYIFLHSNGNDANPGTLAYPKKTPLGAGQACTQDKPRALVLDSALYSQELTSLNNSYFQGFYAAEGKTPKLCLREIGYIPNNTNTIYVSQSAGNDETGNGTEPQPVKTITKAQTLLTQSKTSIMVCDSNVYIEPGFEMSGNFHKLVAKPGTKPTLQLKPSLNNSDFSKMQEIKTVKFDDYNSSTSLLKTTTLKNGNIVIVYHPIGIDDFYFYMIFDKEGNVVKSSTRIYGCGSYISVISLNNGNWVCTFRSTTETGNFIIFDENGNEVVPQTIFDNNTRIMHTCIAPLSNGNWVCTYIRFAYDGSRKGYFFIRDKDGNEIVPVSVLESNDIFSPRCAALSNGTWVCVYGDRGNNSYETFVMYNNDGTIKIPKRVFYNAEVWHDVVQVLDGDKWVCTFVEYNEGRLGKFVIFDKNGNQIVEPKVFSNNRNWTLNIHRLNNNTWICSYTDIDVNNVASQSFVIYDEYGNYITSKKIINPNISFDRECNVAVLNNGNFAFIYLPPTQPYGSRFTIYYPYGYYGIKINNEAEINGFTIDGMQAGMTELINVNSGKLNIKNCNLINVKCITNPNIKSYAIYGEAAFEGKNLLIPDNDYGIYIKNNNAKLSNIVGYRNSGNFIHIDGAGSGINVQHITAYANDTFLKLEHNNGYEVVKNCIINGNANGILADNSIMLKNSLCTDDSHNSPAQIFGENVIDDDPLFIDRGNLNPNDINLHLKRKIFGYNFDSKAIMLGDDNKDAGAYDFFVTIY